MSRGPLPADASGDDLRVADELLGKADALLHRGQHGADAPAPHTLGPLDGDDLPLLTDIVAPSELPAGSTTAPFGQLTSHEGQRPAQRVDASPERRLLEHPGDVRGDPPALAAHRNPEAARPAGGADAALRDAVETWFATEFPQLLTHELAAFSARLQQETLAQLRAVLSAPPDDHDDHGDEGGAPR